MLGMVRGEKVASTTMGGVAKNGSGINQIPLKELFEWALEDPQCFETFKGFAARDFTTENPMFFHEYKKLMMKVKVVLNGVTVVELVKEKEPTAPHATSPASLERGRSSGAPVPHRAFSLSPVSATSSPTTATSSPAPVALPVSSTDPTALPFGIYLPPSTASLPIPQSLLADYRRVYSTFIKPGAPLQLNLPAHLVDHISRQLGKKGDTDVTPPISVFDRAKTEVLGMMFQSFPKFVEEEKSGYLRALRKGKAEGGVMVVEKSAVAEGIA
ncbi:hypothetical protein HDV00_000022 [Rhizophlyctis rosea]|nr:hypothetical protein HDV00_000022 [Rhizophlyctis rosea]